MEKMKKITTHLTTAPSTLRSPLVQKTLDSILQQDKFNMELKNMIQALHTDFKEGLGKLEEELKEVKELMGKSERRLQQVEGKIELMDKRVEEMDNRLTLTDGNQEKMIISLEMDRADYYLRFQNVEEEKGENLADVMAEILAEALEESKEKIINDIDEIFRIHTRYATRNKLPREVLIRFTKKALKADILQKLRNVTIKYKGREIVILKQIPRRVRDLRKEYQFLTKVLIEKGINFRWLIPEGVMVNWQEQRHRLDTLEKAELFYDHYFGQQEEERLRGERGIRHQGDQIEKQRVVADSPVWKAVPKPRDEDFYGKMANMGLGRRSRTTSESSVHSIGRERQNSASTQPSPPPPSIPERKKSPKEAKKERAPQKSGGHWLSWIMGKSRNEAHLPEDKNKSIVWDEKKQRWINLDEPEEETKPPPPPPTGFPQAVVPSGLGGPPNASVNMFSRRAAGSKARYVDIMNPSKAKSPVAAPAPADLFAPLAPMPIPANVFVPNSVPEEQTLLEGGVAQDQVAPGNDANPESIGEVPYLNSAAFPPGPELPAPNPGDAQSGEASSGDPPSGAVQLYNPSQFGQSAAAPASSRPGRFGQRKYPTLK